MNWRYEGKSGGIFEQEDGEWVLFFSDYVVARFVLAGLMRLVGWEPEEESGV
jgi:hypothetical protein